ncbi:TFIID-31kDa-domain-containing protein [Dendrothele bispora CBS 962.96]|uniref:TFIID-31kDa-domain-containing protein n=1 Tax=Dendrothele bispora (strain CBS 962.96) TaxID=1314807 RepID=A0A4S8MZ27_DENBC|nr:TFIID-31kDa-domain-containing protein [Dendrothele bispora CBS 962.96]
MSLSRPTDNLPTTARAIALILSSTPSVQDAQPGVLHQLLEFSHRYTQQVLTDAKVYADHAGRQDKVETEDVVLAVQARVGWEFGGRVPAEYIQNLATTTNAVSLPSVPEVFGVRLPQPSDVLTSIDFDLVPNKPPPGVKLYDEIEEIEESESEEEDEDEDMEPAPIPGTVAPSGGISTPAASVPPELREEAPFPISAVPTGEEDVSARREGSDIEDDDDGLFAGGDDEDSDAMEEVQATPADEVNGVKRQLVETDDYD